MKKRRLTTAGLMAYLDALSNYFPDDGRDYYEPPYKPCSSGMDTLQFTIEQNPNITPAQIWAIAGEQNYVYGLDLVWLLDPLPATRARGIVGVVAAARNAEWFALTSRNIISHVNFDDAEAQLIDEAVNTLGLNLDVITEEVEVEAQSVAM